MSAVCHRDVGASQMNGFSAPPAFGFNGNPYAGLNGNPGWQAAGHLPHSSSLLSQRLQAQQAAQHM